MGRIRGIAGKLRKPTYAEVVATLALFVALGGVSYAAIKIPNNSVGAKQLKKNAVDSSKVKDRSLLARDFKQGQLPRGATGEAGSMGPAGPTGVAGIVGPTGARGATGADGVAGLPGPTGADGIAGPTGADGIAGPTGPDGPRGLTGADGNIGPTGNTGPAGPSSTAVMSSGTDLAMFANEYFPISGSAVTTAGAGASTTLSPNVPVTASNFRVKLSNQPGPGLDREIRLLADGATILSCNMYWTETSCSDSDSVVIAPGTELVLYSNLPHLPAMGANFARVMVGFTLGP